MNIRIAHLINDILFCIGLAILVVSAFYDYMPGALIAFTITFLCFLAMIVINSYKVDSNV